jgi:hypothetical protein
VILLSPSSQNEFFIKSEKELLKIIDNIVNLKEMKENYVKAFKMKRGEIELTAYVFERIYEIDSQKYIIPKKSRL